MGITELLGLAASVSLLAGWRFYLCIFVTGIAMRTGWLAPPQNIAELQALGSPAVLAISGFGLVAEFAADKVPWLDTLWDAIHTIIRPIGGALVAAAIIDSGDPAVQAASFLLGGGAAFTAHLGKTGARAMINASPEPFSNIVVSLAEDVTTAALLAFAFTYPVAAGFIALALLFAVIWLLRIAKRVIDRRLRAKRAARRAYQASEMDPLE